MGFRTAEAKRPRMGQGFQNGGQMISKLGLWQDVKLRAILRHPRSQINHPPPMYLSWGSSWNIWSLTIRAEIKTQASGKMPTLMGEGEAVGPPCGGSGGLLGLESWDNSSQGKNKTRR